MTKKLLNPNDDAVLPPPIGSASKTPEQDEDMQRWLDDYFKRSAYQRAYRAANRDAIRASQAKALKKRKGRNRFLCRLPEPKTPLKVSLAAVTTVQPWTEDNQVTRPPFEKELPP